MKRRNAFTEVGRAVVATLALLLTACGGDGGETSARDGGRATASVPNVVQVDATEYAYSMPQEVEGGVVTFELANVGALPHEFASTRIDAGKTAQDLLKALDSGKDPSKFSWIHYFPGVPVVSPGENVSITREVDDEGTYVFFCGLPSPQGKPHYRLGMIRSLEIAGASGAQLPEADAAIEATDKGFEVPSLRAGRQMLELRNAGTTEHEFWLWAFAPGKTNKDVNAWVGRGMQGPAPATFFGAVKSIPAGTSVFLEIDLKAGTTYTVQDFDNRLRAELVVP